MSFLLHVEFDATSESTATKILECLSGMADIVHRDYPEVYTYVFRYANEQVSIVEQVKVEKNNPLSQITASILDNYLHVTYIPVQQGFFHRNFNEKSEMNLLILCRGCDEDVYEQLNTLVNCVTSITFEESDGNRQLIALITNISNEKQSIKDKKSLIDTIEIVCSNEETIRKLKNIIENYFQIQSIHIQTSFSGYIRHKSFL